MTTKKTNLWMEHVKAFKQSHPDMTYKLILQEARKTYTKLKQPIESIVKSKTKAKKTQKSVTKKPNSWMDHIKQVRVDNPEMSYKEAMQKAKISYRK